MQPDYSPIVQKVLDAAPYFVGILAFIFALNLLERGFGRRKRRRWKGSRGWESQRGKVLPFQVDRPTDAADQLRIVMHSSFKSQPLLNKGEARLFKTLVKILAELRPDWQVMAQVSLGEILQSRDEEAYACINSKRVDLLIVDSECRPVHAIEYQGEGHHQGTAAARDAVKKEALRRAGIGYTEVVPGDTPAELRRLIEKLIQPL